MRGGVDRRHSDEHRLLPVTGTYAGLAFSGTTMEELLVMRVCEGPNA